MNFTLITWALCLLAVVVLTTLLARLRPRLLGAQGQAAVSRRLRRYCAEVADDLILPNGRGGLAQIDHLVLTPAGLVVVETKNYSGLIFGEVRDRTWTQCIGRATEQVREPAATELRAHKGSGGFSDRRAGDGSRSIHRSGPVPEGGTEWGDDVIGVVKGARAGGARSSLH